MFLSEFFLLELLIGGGCFALSLGASAYVKYSFNRGKEIAIRSGKTGADIARMILRDQDVHDVQVVEHEGFLTDHYNPGDKTLNLSSEVYHGQNAASAGVAAHEVGHALQHAQGDLTMWGRTILVYPAHFGGMLAPYLAGFGLMLGAATQVAKGVPGLAYWMLMVGVVLFAVSALCAIVIVFNEFNASARARTSLVRLGITRPGEEDDTVKSVLNAAGLTYVAAAATALLWLLYYLWRAGIIGGGRRDD